MPINRYSQSRRSHLERKAKDSYKVDKVFGAETPSEEKGLKDERKKKRSSKKR